MTWPSEKMAGTLNLMMEDDGGGGGVRVRAASERERERERTESIFVGEVGDDQ